MDTSLILDASRRWLETVVIRHGLCPFASRVLDKNGLSLVVSEATTPDALVRDLTEELLRLNDHSRAELETTLLIHPYVLTGFQVYNDFLNVVDAIIDEAGLRGVLQVASFHPDYRFADSQADDAANYSNRSPFPMLHLLREASIDEAVRDWTARGRQMEDIPLSNTRTLRRMGKSLLEKQLLACKEAVIEKK
ncbi:DUF1415 domain-containing protein [Sulfuriflexus sp.]|uniref:DUF1415 domain-containing protein n=1 Tax=Sulfuriflexus sp. TaxID=2015443 RepID=UPI0028D58192|nr:DUF1415 domain-containing protein [Sulfuriflexus sp.]